MPPPGGKAVKIAVRVQGQAARWLASPVAFAVACELDQSGQNARRGHSKDGAIVECAASSRGAIEIAVSAEGECSRRTRPFVARTIAREGNQRGEFTAGCDSEDRTHVVGTAVLRRAVEVAIWAQKQAAERSLTHRRSAGAGQRDQRGQLTLRRHLEDGAKAVRTTARCCAVEVPVRRQNHPSGGFFAWVVRTVVGEVDQCLVSPRRIHTIDHALVMDASARAGSVEPAVGGMRSEIVVKPHVLGRQREIVTDDPGVGLSRDSHVKADASLIACRISSRQRDRQRASAQCGAWHGRLDDGHGARVVACHGLRGVIRQQTTRHQRRENEAPGRCFDDGRRAGHHLHVARDRGGQP